MAGNGRRDGDGRRHEVRATAASLTTFEVPVRGRRAALAGGELVGIHPKTHRASRLAPFEACLEKDLVKAFGLGLHLDAARSRYDQRSNARVHAGTPWRPQRRRVNLRCASWYTSQ